MRIICALAAVVIAVACLPIRTQADDLREITAKAAVVIDADSGEVLFAKNENVRLPMASTTKIMTALITLEQDGLDDEFTVDSNAIKTEGSSMGLREGDRVTLRALACGMLLPSGNDAANAAAVRICGSVESFAGLMNRRAHSMGLYNTNFVTPSGLDDDTSSHYSSAFDMARLAAEAIKNKDFTDICSQEEITVRFGSPPYDRTLYNTNKLLGSYSGVFGVKTGFTDKAGRCLVSACKRDGKTLVCVTLNDRDDWNEHRALYDCCFGMFEQKLMSESRKKIDLPVVGSKEESVSCTVESVSVSVLKARSAEIEAKVFVPAFIYAPVGKNETVGSVVYMLDGKEIARADIRTDVAVSLYKNEDDESIFDLIGLVWELVA